jgi:hypothetical protein
MEPTVEGVYEVGALTFGVLKGVDEGVRERTYATPLAMPPDGVGEPAVKTRFPST